MQSSHLDISLFTEFSGIFLRVVDSSKPIEISLWKNFHSR